MTERPLVVALGGNALLRRGEPSDSDTQRANVRRAAEQLAVLAERGPLVVTHGNGPQVGLLALQAEADPTAPSTPLDVLGAETEGMIGYLIEQELRNVLKVRQVATLLTQVIVDADDPAFGRPTKPIGPTYTQAQAQRLAVERGWSVGADGSSWRRLVPSPQPRRIIEMPAIRKLASDGTIVICAGGGGVPVVVRPDHATVGVEAVIDKDLASALLAIELGARGLLLLTDVETIQLGWGTPDARPLRRTSPRHLRELGLATGSMGPKAEAAARYVEHVGHVAAIGSLEQAALLLDGEHGTEVIPDA